MSNFARRAVTTVYLVLLALPVAAETVGWRMDGDGRYPEAKPPLSWSEESNVLWKTPLPASSNASPVLIESAKTVIVLSDPDEVVAVDADDGTVRWSTSVGDVEAKKVGAHKANGRTSATPVSDGERVFAVFGSGVVAAYDLDGKRLWARVVQQPTHRWGHSASPALVGGRLIVHYADLIALDPESGDEVWRAISDARWGSPVAARIGETEVVVTPSGDVFQVADGTPVAGGVGSLKYATPLVQDGVIYFIEKRATAVRLPESLDGDFEPLWQARLEGSRHYASPVIDGGRLYAVSREQKFSILDVETGELLHAGSLDLDSGANSAYPSLAVAGGKMFLSTENGATVVLEPGASYEELGRSSIEGFRSTPVFAGKRIYIRTFGHLYCLEE